MQWLISPRDDLLWLLGSVAVAWAMFAIWSSQIISTMTLVVIWVFALHGPHFWATYSRTYADREQFRRRRKLFTQSLVWFAIAPAVVGVGLLFEHATGRDELVLLFFFLAAMWAFHHVAKQHFGFLALYRAKHREFHRRDFLFHKYYLLISLWMPALIMLTNNFTWLEGIPGVRPYYSFYGAAGVVDIQRTQVFLLDACTYIFWTAQAAFVATMIWRVITGRGFNLPVLLLVSCCVPLTWIVLMTCLDSEIPGGYFVFVPILTAYHNIQYHALVWYYNTKKYRRKDLTPEARATIGPAVRINRNLAIYWIVGGIFTAATIGFEYYGIEAVRGGASETLFRSVFWGFAFHHYYLDSKIWHASADAELRQILGFQGPKKKEPETVTIAAPVRPVATGVPEAS